MDAGGDSADALIKVWAYHAKRMFGDRLVGKESREKFEGMLTSIARNDWSVTLDDAFASSYYVTWGSTGGLSKTGNVAGSFGRPLGLLTRDDFKQIVSKGLTAYGKNLKSIKFHLLINPFSTLLILNIFYQFDKTS